MWKLLKKDLLRLRKHPGGFLLVSLAPLLSALFMLMVFGSDGNNVTPHVTLVVEDRDDSMASSMVKQAFSRGELAEMFTLENVDDARAVVEDDDASAGLIIPQGFQRDILDRKPVSLELIKNPSQSFMPKITEEVMHILSEGLNRLLYIAEGPLQHIYSQITGAEETSKENISAISVDVYEIFQKVQPLLNEPPITLKETEITSNAEEDKQGNILFIYLLTGLSVMFMLFTANGMANDYFNERLNYTMQRIIISPVGRTHYVLSKHVYLLLTTLFSFYLIWAIAFALNGTTPLQLLQFFILSLFIINALVAVTSLCYTLISTQTQANAMMPAVNIILSALGGGMIPLQNLPPFVHKIAIISPVYWGVDALQKLLLDGVDLASLSMHLIILAAIGIVLSSTAILVQQRRLHT